MTPTLFFSCNGKFRINKDPLNKDPFINHELFINTESLCNNEHHHHGGDHDDDDDDDDDDKVVVVGS